MPKPIEVHTYLYERSHGRKPKGFGGWGFIVMDESCDREVEFFFTPAMTLSDAKVWAKAHVRTNFAEQVATGYLGLEVAP
ncbi:hypothetical protein MesoLj131c_62370 [Mesorhizobium sp. 131-3-5]|uniref:hypothetical protein n=1 Tax=Mesorhizobium sp. 131-3-5 TaxID=2744520 RepID=UPI0019288C5D|nr:hypothetical protein [Mesorhizobium sp. 131-3-5]BCH11979.1 hypothetical protein MesoLj131c_62370 [Mesorhizobium sp. 131-3-5]